MAAQPLAMRVGVVPACQALGVSRATFYRRRRSTPGHQQPRPTPARALCEAEREQILDVLAGPRFVDRAPAEVVATLLDEGHYLCSERTMYRILAADQPVRERRNQREHPRYAKPELVATAPNQTWSWDITKLLGPTKWSYFYLYVVLDIFSRYAVGWMVADRENSALAGRLIEETCHKQGIQPRVLTLHSDRGAPMTSKCTAQLLADLGVTRSLSRPQVSDDNPFSEAQFKTLKYHPGFLAASTTSPPRSPSAEHSSLGTTPSIAMAGSRCSPRTTSITIEPGACWTSAGAPFKPPGPVIPNASFAGSQNQIPFPKRSGSIHRLHPQQERLLSKSQPTVSQSR